MDMDIASAKAKQLCVPKAYGDYKELVEDPEVQCVHIFTAYLSVGTLTHKDEIIVVGALDMASRSAGVDIRNAHSQQAHPGDDAKKRTRRGCAFRERRGRSV